MLKGWNWKTRNQCLWRQDPRTWVEGEQNKMLLANLWLVFLAKKTKKMNKGKENQKERKKKQNWPLLAKFNQERIQNIWNGFKAWVLLSSTRTTTSTTTTTTTTTIFRITLEFFGQKLLRNRIIHRWHYFLRRFFLLPGLMDLKGF